MFVQQVLHAVNAETFTLGAGKQDLPVTALALSQPSLQDGKRGFGNRCTAFLAALAGDPQVRARTDDKILSFEPGLFAPIEI